MSENPVPHYLDLMQQALWRVHAAEMQISQASSVEEHEMAHYSLQVAKAEVQQLIRSAKRDAGVPLRPIDELESLHRGLRQRLNRGREQKNQPAQSTERAST